ncbi:MAG: nuclear transport factor 2 family protein [Myxococcota bacterium]
MSFHGPLEDRLAIRELVDRYSDAVSRFDLAVWETLWAEDGEWELMGNHLRGAEAIHDFWKAVLGSLEFVFFQAQPVAVDISGDRATGRVLVAETLKPKNGDRRVVQATYDDTYTKRDGEWRFQTRRHHVLSDF